MEHIDNDATRLVKKAIERQIESLLTCKTTTTTQQEKIDELATFLFYKLHNLNARILKNEIKHINACYS